MKSPVEPSQQVAVIFEVKPKSTGKDEYLRIAQALKEQLQQAQGLISAERFSSLVEEGKLLSLSIWQDMESVNQWRNQLQHRMGQEKGYRELFERYTIRVALIQREYSITKRAQAPTDSNQHLGIPSHD